jgi:hypothetical protein
LLLLVAGLALPAGAQTAQSAQDAPSIRVGTTIYADYTVQQEPQVLDADGNPVTLSAFNITRAYINVTGRISRRVTFRLTPDIARETSPTSALNGSYVFRLKFAYGQLALDSWLPSGSWARFGLQATPWMDFSNEVYRYRFQGSVFEEREGYLFFADVGATAHVAFGEYGDVHGGMYNGEGSYKPEVNDQKAFMLRATGRPLATNKSLHGLRVTAFIDRDAYTRNRERDRTILAATFEHPIMHAGFDYLFASDRPAGQLTTTEARGYSAFATPRSKSGWEGLLRYDWLRADEDRPLQEKTRRITGVAYWLKPVNGVTGAILFDVERVSFSGFTPAQQPQRRIAVHTLIQY